MVRALVTSANVGQQALLLPSVTADEIEPEALAEILRRVEQMKRSEGKLYSNEEASQALGLDPVRIGELLDELP